jgi:hypothetical protein
LQILKAKPNTDVQPDLTGVLQSHGRSLQNIYALASAFAAQAASEAKFAPGDKGPGPGDMAFPVQ